MTSDNAKILNALKTRLQSITTTAGYPLTVKKVELNAGDILMNTNSLSLPYIEIINGDNKIEEHNVGGNVRGSLNITLRIVQAKSTSDALMSDFESAVIRCLFGNTYLGSPTASASRLNNGTRDLLTHMRYTSTFTDLNMINANRIWDINLALYYSRNITNF